MTVRELIAMLQTMPQNARVQMGYDGNYVSVQPNGKVFEVTVQYYIYGQHTAACDATCSCRTGRASK